MVVLKTRPTLDWHSIQNKTEKTKVRQVEHNVMNIMPAASFSTATAIVSLFDLNNNSKLQ